MSTQAHKNASPKITLSYLECAIAELRSRLARLEETDDREADTIVEFCRRWNISRATYYSMKNAGLAPREMRPGPDGKGPILISRAAQADWRKMQEQRVGEAR